MRCHSVAFMHLLDIFAAHSFDVRMATAEAAEYITPSHDT